MPTVLSLGAPEAPPRSVFLQPHEGSPIRVSREASRSAGKSLHQCPQGETPRSSVFRKTACSPVVISVIFPGRSTTAWHGTRFVRACSRGHPQEPLEEEPPLYEGNVFSTRTFLRGACPQTYPDPI